MSLYAEYTLKETSERKLCKTEFDKLTREM